MCIRDSPQQRAVSEDITAHTADFFEDAQAALYGQTDFPAHAPWQLMYQRGAFEQQTACTIRLEIK